MSIESLSSNREENIKRIKNEQIEFINDFKALSPEIRAKRFELLKPFYQSLVKELV